jgi:hypothetical protein
MPCNPTVQSEAEKSAGIIVWLSRLWRDHLAAARPSLDGSMEKNVRRNLPGKWPESSTMLSRRMAAPSPDSRASHSDDT